LNTLDGPWVAVRYDPASRVCALARDKFGLKQLFYAFDQEDLVFSDRLPVLLELLKVRRLRFQALLEWIHLGVPWEPLTFFDDVFAVEPGHVIRFHGTPARVTKERYYHPSDSVSRERRGEWEATKFDALERPIEERLSESIARAAAGRAQVTTLLSGGVDSSLLAALAVRTLKVQAVTVSLGGNQPRGEKPFAQAVARHLGLDHHLVELSAADFRASLCDTVWHLATPLVLESAVALVHLARRGHFPKECVILDGEGADALFGGAVSLFKPALLGYMFRRGFGVPKGLTDRLIRRGRALFGRLGFPTRSVADFPGVDRALGVRLAERLLHQERNRRALALGSDPFEPEIIAPLLDDFQGALRPLVQRLDPAARQVGAHILLPFLESDFFSMAANLPLKARIRVRPLSVHAQPKWLLKKLAARLVPKHVVYRPKVGFEIPGSEWTGPFPAAWVKESWLAETFQLSQPALEQWLISARSRRDYFFMTSAEIWGRLFVRRQSRESVEAEFLESTTV
jgi:asparagine synthase (glutamine-hydrolysing)